MPIPSADKQRIDELERQLALNQAAEKVREAVLAMRGSSGLMDVVGVMHQCLDQLGVATYSTGIVFFDEAREQVQHYLAIRDMQPYGFKPKNINRMDLQGDKEIAGGFFVRWFNDSLPQWRSHAPLAEERLAAWRQGRLTEGHFTFTRAGLLRTWQATDPDRADWSALESLTGEVILTHVPFHYGVVSFAVQTVSEQHLPTIQALTEALSLGYLRFLDFQQLEARNRELTIQNALERVRAQALGMQQSNEIAGVSTALFDQFLELGYELLHLNIAIKGEEDIVESWLTSSGQESGLTDAQRFSKSPVLMPVGPNQGMQREETEAARTRGEPHYVFELIDAENEAYFRQSFLVRGLSPEETEARLEKMPKRAYRAVHRIFYSHGYIGIVTSKRLTDENLTVARRFTEVFAYAYRRFRELEAKEAQNRELTIQNAIERVRAQALGMQETSQLDNVSVALFEGLGELGFDLIWCCIWLVDEVEDRMAITLQFADAKNLVQNSTSLSAAIAASPVTRSLMDQFRRQENAYAFSVTDQALADHLAYWEPVVQATNPDFQLPQALVTADTVYQSGSFFRYGGLEIATLQDLDRDKQDIRKRFTEVFEFAYTRFLELQAKEEQAEQAQRERTMERIRAEAMSMRRTDDLYELTATFFREVRDLGINTWYLSLTFIEQEEITTYCNAIANWTSMGLELKQNPQFGLKLVNDDAVIYAHHGARQHPFKSDKLRAFQTQQISSAQADTGIAETRRQVLNRWTGSECDVERVVENFPKSEVIYQVPFSHGVVSFSDPKNSTQTMGLLAESFALGYLRYLDFQKLEAELEKAHDLQQRLMPTAGPQIAGFALAGRCQPATHVSGDFFQYFPLGERRLALCLADVTGHAMDAAIPMVQFSGILQTEMQYGHDLARLYGQLNRTLHRNLDNRTYVCFAMAELDPSNRSVRLANAGCPFPFHYQAKTGKVIEHEVVAYPLGARAQTDFPVVEVQLAPGDRLVLCSDGIIEAANAEEDLFGFEQTAATIQEGCQQGLDAERLLERLLERVRAFSGTVDQEDDQTIVVLQVDEESR